MILGNKQVNGIYKFSMEMCGTEIFINSQAICTRCNNFAGRLIYVRFSGM